MPGQVRSAAPAGTAVYVDAAETVRSNGVAVAFIHESAHHTPACQQGRERAAEQRGWPFARTLCFCDLLVHVARIIEAERGR